MEWYEVVWSRNCKHIKSHPSCHKTFSLSCQRIACLRVCDLCCRQVTNYGLNDLNCNFLMKKPRIAMLDGNGFAALGKETNACNCLTRVKLATSTCAGLKPKNHSRPYSRGSIGHARIDLAAHSSSLLRSVAFSADTLQAWAWLTAFSRD